MHCDGRGTAPARWDKVAFVIGAANSLVTVIPRPSNCVYGFR